MSALNTATLASRPAGASPADAGASDTRADTLTQRQNSFSAALARGSRGDLPPEQEARETAQRFVADALVFPLLKQLRAQNNAAAPFAPTGAEKQFQAIADAATARSIAGASNFPLVDRIAADLLRAQAEQDTRPGGEVSDAHGS